LVDVGFGVEARPRIAIPVPGAADAGGGIDGLDLEALFVAQLVELVKAGNSCASSRPSRARESRGVTQIACQIRFSALSACGD
jgi:hypothetical protein